MTEQLLNENVAGDDEATERMKKRVETILKHAEDFRRHGEDGSADAALALAEKIMLKFSIDAAVLAASVSVGDRAPIVTEWVAFTGIYRAALLIQFQQLVKAYSNVIQTFGKREGPTYRLALVGEAHDVLQLKSLITSIHLQAIGKMNLWWGNLPARDRSGGMEGFKARREFVANFVRGATARIDEARRLTTQESEPGTALALRDRAADVNAYVNATYRLRDDNVRMKRGSLRAERDGYAAGRLANTGDTPVGGGRPQLES